MNQYSGHELEGLKEARNYYSWLIQEYSGYITGKVLEVGAGIGTLSMYLLRLPIHELVCLEPSYELSLLLNKSLCYMPVRIFPQKLDQFRGNHSGIFDTIICVNVLEHIDDDYRALVAMNELLKIGGNLCLFVPAVSWLYGALDRSFGHYRRYNKKQFEELLVRSGFVAHKLKYFNAVGMLTWILMGKVLKWENWDSQIVMLYDRIVTPVIRKIEKFVSPPIGQSLLFVGTKVENIPIS